MTPKIKILIACLTVITVFSVYQIITSIGSVGLKNPSGSSRLNMNEPVTTDADQDGLTDTEETLWNTNFQNPDSDGDGFKDGEEVASGHNPLKKGPDDFLDNNLNITQNAANIVAAGLMSGKIAPNDTSIDSAIGVMSDSIVRDFYNSQPGVPQLILPPGDNSIAGQKAYLERIAQIVGRHLLDLKSVDSDKNADDMAYTKKSALTIAKIWQAIYDDLSDVSTPSSWNVIHLRFLDVANRNVFNYRFVADYEKDVVKAMLALNEITKGLAGDRKALVVEILNKAEKSEFFLTQDFYNVMQTLYK